MRFLQIGLTLFMCSADMACLHGQEAPAKEAQFSCGLNATYIYLNRAGHHVAYAQLVREFEGETPSDSLLAVRNVLAKHGCQTVAVKADSEYLLGEKHPAIVYLELDGYSLHGERHFSYMVTASRDRGVELLDPIFEAYKPSFMTWDTFARMFKGIALVAHE